MYRFAARLLGTAADQIRSLLPSLAPVLCYAQWEDWAAQLCSDASSAGQKLAQAFIQGGLAAARAFKATAQYCGQGGPQLNELVGCLIAVVCIKPTTNNNSTLQSPDLQGSKRPHV